MRGILKYALSERGRGILRKRRREKSCCSRKAREMGGDKETLFFFFSTIFLIKLDQSETELRPWLSYLSLSKFITKLGYPKVLPLIRDPNFLDPASILFDSAIRNILATSRAEILPSRSTCPLLTRDKGTTGRQKFRVRSRNWRRVVLN